MRSVVVLSVFSVLALGAATAAIADGAPVSITPAPAARDGWSGLYIGLGGGASRVEHSGSNDTHVWKKKEKCGKHDYDWYSGKCDGGWEPVDYWDHTFKNPFGEETWEGFGTIQVGYDRLIHDHLLIGAFATSTSMVAAVTATKTISSRTASNSITPGTSADGSASSSRRGCCSTASAATRRPASTNRSPSNMGRPSMTSTTRRDGLPAAAAR